jgi:hypothetical protein
MTVISVGDIDDYDLAEEVKLTWRGAKIGANIYFC